MSFANELASTLQSASLNRHPDPAHDINPSTSASQKNPVTLSHHTPLDDEPTTARAQGRRVHITSSAAEAETGRPSSASPHRRRNEEDSRIPLSILRPLPRNRPTQPTLPPLPDLRFEQSYLARLKPYLPDSDTTSASSSSSTSGPNAAASKSYNYAMIAYITVLDHVLMPLSQGVVYNLAVLGWRSWNTGVKFRGRSVGARVRRWWWGVNGWEVPGEAAAK